MSDDKDKISIPELETLAKCVAEDYRKQEEAQIKMKASVSVFLSQLLKLQGVPPVTVYTEDPAMSIRQLFSGVHRLEDSPTKTLLQHLHTLLPGYWKRRK